MVEMVWSGILDINMVENGMEWNGMKWNEMEVMGRDRYLHGKDIFPILFSFFSLSYSSLYFLLIFFPCFFLSSSFLHFRFFFSFSSSCIL